MFRSSRILIVPMTLLVLVATFSYCHAAVDPPLVDIVHLKNGGTLYGKVTDAVVNKQRIYIVETTDGGTLKLRRSQVARIQRPDERLLEYLKRKSAVANTVDAHWEMQNWCNENRLYKQREFHLMQVIRLDPDHKDARNRLKYKDVNGVWVQTDHFYQNHGYVKDSGGKFRIPLAMEMKERKDGGKLLSKQWNRRLKGWLTKAKSKEGDVNALASLQAVKDPAAVPGLVELVRAEKNAGVQNMLLDIIGQIESAGAQNSLVVLAMDATDPRNQEHCVTLLKQPHYNQAGVVSSLLPFLRPQKKTPNGLVNKAAWIIGQMDDTSAIRPLISALVTTHAVPTGAPGGNMNLNNEGNGNGGLQMGKKPAHVDVNFQNQSVLDSLKVLSGKVDFGFDEIGWLHWYIRRNSLGTNSLNRDP